jgi:hypothetical protein
MTTPVRTPGKYGRRAPKRAPMLQLGPLLTGIVPEHPVAADYLAELDGGWAMLGNDLAGDCVAVTWANVRRLVSTVLGSAGYYPTQAEVWAVYQTQNPDFDPAGTADTNGPGSSADGGMDIQTLLEYLTKTPGPDGVKAIAFASVNRKNPAEVKAAIAIFGYVWTGINVLDINMQQFAASKPFDYDPSSPVDGGHSVATGGYGAPEAGALGGDERFITWAQETSFTDAFWSEEVEETFVVIWPEHLGTKEFLEGINIVALAADYKAITHRKFPAIPVPASTGVAMSGPVPETGPLGRVEKWAEEHLTPDIADIKAAVAGLEDRGDKALTWLEAHAANAKELAGLVVQVVKVIDPADASLAAGLVSKAEAVLAEAERIAEEVLGEGA